MVDGRSGRSRLSTQWRIWPRGLLDRVITVSEQKAGTADARGVLVHRLCRDAAAQEHRVAVLGAGRLRAPMIMTRIKATSPMAAMDRRGLAPHLSNTGRLTEVCLAHMGTVRDSSPALPV